MNWVVILIFLIEINVFWLGRLWILFNPRNSDTRICSSNISADAVTEFMKHRYPRYDTCDKPCTQMDIQTSLVSKSESKNPKLEFTFSRMVPVSKEVLSHSSFSLVAEVGGYLGLTLGLSLMHLELPIKMVWNQVLLWKARKGVSSIESVRLWLRVDHTLCKKLNDPENRHIFEGSNNVLT